MVFYNPLPIKIHVDRRVDQSSVEWIVNPIMGLAITRMDRDDILAAITKQLDMRVVPWAPAVPMSSPEGLRRVASSSKIDEFTRIALYTAADEIERLTRGQK